LTARTACSSGFQRCMKWMADGRETRGRIAPVSSISDGPTGLCRDGPDCEKELVIDPISPSAAFLAGSSLSGDGDEYSAVEEHFWWRVDGIIRFSGDRRCLELQRSTDGFYGRFAVLFPSGRNHFEADAFNRGFVARTTVLSAEVNSAGAVVVAAVRRRQNFPVSAGHDDQMEIAARDADGSSCFRSLGPDD